MAAASFEDLCAGFCEVAGVPVPALGQDEFGRVAIHAIVRGVTVNLVHCPRASPDHFFLFFELGPLPPPGPGHARALEALLEANFVLDVCAPVFGRNPLTGNATMQQVVALFDATPSGLHDLIGAGVERVAVWRERLAGGWDAAEEDAPPTPASALFNLA